MMKNITYISAGAGSGKTFTLTHLLSDLIKEGKVAPEQVILTTFTKKASQDFKERSKEVLYENGLYAQATALDNAMIGTIHSVAMNFIGKYWFFLGLSPSLETIAEEDVLTYQTQSLSSLPTDEEIAFLKNFVRKFNIRKEKDYKPSLSLDYNFWKAPLRAIIAKATNHSVESFDISREKSKEFFKKFVIENLNVPQPRGKELENILEKVKTMLKFTTSKSKIGEFEEFWNNRKYPTIAYYSRLGKYITSLPAKCLDKDPETVELGQRFLLIWQSKEVYDSLAQYIDIIFDLAERWRDKYAQFKRENNLLDFDDQEKYFYELLMNSECAGEISKGYRYVFVDEFQDCSPLQVKIFSRLSELVEHSYWVGDNKQAIFGFRASDPVLTGKVAEIIEQTPENGNMTKTLEKSYRSVPEIVKACNKIFTQVFNPIPIEKVVLKETRKSLPDTSPLIIWAEADKDSIAEGVVSMVAEGESPNDIAILARNNDILGSIGNKIENFGVPVNRESFSVKDSRVTRMLAAVLNIFANEADYLAKAELGFLVEKDLDTENLIEQILSSPEEPGKYRKSFLDRLPLVKKIEKIRQHHRFQSLSQAVESVILEANLYEEAKKISSEDESTRVIDTIIKEAEKFEESSERLGIVPSVSRFVSHLMESEIKVPGNPQGVNLLTIHSSKGLQWKKVILVELYQDVNNINKGIKREVFGVHFHRTDEITASNLFPEVFITVLPFIYGQGNTNPPEFVVSKIKNDCQVILDHKVQEEARLLYVAFTRPKDTLILTEIGKKPFLWVNQSGVLKSDTQDFVNDYGFLLDNPPIYDRTKAVLVNGNTQLTYDIDFDNRSTSEKRDYSPSSVEGTKSVKKSYDFNFRIPHNSLPSNFSDADLGNCIHHIFHSFEFEEPSAKVMERIIKEHGFSFILPSTSEITQSWENLLHKIEEIHGKIISHRHERPFKHHLDGKIYTGSIDMTVETEHGIVLIDFKSCPMGSKVLKEDNSHYVGHYGGQLSCYARALRDNGEKLIGGYIYYPVSGILVELDI